MKLRALALSCGLVAAPVGLQGCAPTDGNTTCEPGEVCMWVNDDYLGCFNDLIPPNTDSDYTNASPDWNNCQFTINDHISSYINRSGGWIKWYYDSGFNGYSFCAAPSASSTDLQSFYRPGAPSPEDDFSAHQTYGSEPAGCTFTDRN
jgi:hypothetical protein